MGRHGLVGVDSAHIGGTVAQISADSAPGNDFTAHEMRPAQCTRGIAHTTFGYGCPNFGRRKGIAVAHYGVDAIKPKIKYARKLLKLGVVTLAVAAKAVVVAHDQVLHSQVTDQVAAHKIERRGLGKVRSEGLLHERVEPQCGQELSPFRGQCEARQLKTRINQPARVRLEGQKNGRSADFASFGQGAFYQGLMAQMHPVKGA